jgi:nicotinate-nucleotide adenylyltransferase
MSCDEKVDCGRRRLIVATAAAGGVAGLPVTQLDISATAVREMCRKGLSPRYLLPDGVIDYIRDQQLYM